MSPLDPLIIARRQRRRNARRVPECIFQTVSLFDLPVNEIHNGNFGNLLSLFIQATCRFPFKNTS